MNAVSRQAAAQHVDSTFRGILTIPFVGLAVFTFIVVMQRWSVAWPWLILALAGLILQSRKLRFPAPFWWGVAFLGWALLTSFSAMSTQVTLDVFVLRLKAIVIFLVTMNALVTKNQLRIYLLVVLAGFMIYPARGALVNYIHGETLYGRAIWNRAYNNPNELAVYALLSMGVALSIAAVKTQSKSVRWAAGACVPVLLTVVLLTQSRAAFLGLAIGFGPLLLSRIMKRPSVAVYALIAGSLVVNFIPDKAWHRFAGIQKLSSSETIAQADPEGSAAQRYEIQKTAWRIFSDHPVLGVGLGCYGIANALYRPDLGGKDTHNTYLNLAAELGLPGLLLWSGLVVSVMLFVRRSSRTAVAGTFSVDIVWIEGAIAGYLVAGLFGSFSGVQMLYIVLGALWCSASIASREVSNNSETRRSNSGKL